MQGRKCMRTGLWMVALEPTQKPTSTPPTVTPTIILTSIPPNQWEPSQFSANCKGKRHGQHPKHHKQQGNGKIPPPIHWIATILSHFASVDKPPRQVSIFPRFHSRTHHKTLAPVHRHSKEAHEKGEEWPTLYQKYGERNQGYLDFFLHIFGRA